MRDLILQGAGAAAIVVAFIHGALGETKVFAKATITPEKLRTLFRESQRNNEEIWRTRDDYRRTWPRFLRRDAHCHFGRNRVATLFRRAPDRFSFHLRHSMRRAPILRDWGCSQEIIFLRVHSRPRTRRRSHTFFPIGVTSQIRIPRAGDSDLLFRVASAI